MYAICASERDTGGFGGDCEEEESGGGRARREVTGGIAVELWIRNRSRIPLSLVGVCVVGYGRLLDPLLLDAVRLKLSIGFWTPAVSRLVDLQEAYWYFSIAFF
ncbi:unnamed protein product [Musa acuminata subsp. malaccensis]|uniref:(wild Malaysian banana) hypothetical protein n=1 Tax=Musa acuminata subsp. malaccensis TaxID=214687 RepID=A0A804I2X4_MUSAM|nr:unnamed protein product [Musa acuminata subsp. malaccensis]